MMSEKLSAPLEYFPVSKNPFEFKTGLRRLPAAGEATSAQDKIFQIDNAYVRYSEEKQLARNEAFDKYICEFDLEQHLANEISCRLGIILSQEYPEWFSFVKKSARNVLVNRLLLTQVEFDDEGNILTQTNTPGVAPYRHGLDAICCQIQEDLSVVQIKEHKDIIRFLHLCFPNYWRAKDKIGHSFQQAHISVPGMEKVNLQSRQLNQLLVQEGPFERFTWGLVTDTRLNHHPDPPSEKSVEWLGRDFDNANSNIYLRSERQVTLPFADQEAYVFLIRTYFTRLIDCNAEQLSRVKRALLTMPDAILKYKGLYEAKATLCAKLDALLENVK